MLNHLFSLALTAVLGVGIVSNAKADEVDRLIEVFQLRNDLKNQYDECIESTSKTAEEDLNNTIKESFEGIYLDSDDLAILSRIYTEYWTASCNFWESKEVLDFYKNEFRNRFTSEEVQELIKFYETPLGIKLSSQWIEINHKVGKIVSDRQISAVREALKLYEARMEKFMEHLEEKAIEGSVEGNA